MLVVRNLALIKNGVKILSDVSLQIAQPSLVTLLGPSGSGKTSLLRCLAGLERYQGDVEWNGQIMNSVPPEKRQFGFVEQDSTLFPHLTAYDNIAYPLKLRRKKTTHIQRAVTDLAEQLHLTQVLQRQPHQLSGGEQRRVMLARTLIYEPLVLLCDEPFAGVDALLRVELVHLLKTILLERPVPTVYVTHDLAEADFLSQQRLIIRAGRIVDPADPWVQTFLRQRF